MPSTTVELNVGGLEAAQAELAAVVAGVGPEAFHYYLAVSEELAEEAEVLYTEYLGGKKPLPNGQVVKRRDDDVLQGIGRRAAGVLQWDLYNTAKEAEGIEEGSPEFDMKSILPTAKKARQAKDGTLYLIIPFRHGIPTSRTNPMPKAVHKLAKQLTYSQNLGAPGTRMSATGHLVPKFEYHWGDRLTKAHLAGAGLDEKAQRRYAGLYRFGSPTQSQYLTFRTMSQKSKGWIRKATPGLYPLQTALEVTVSTGQARLEQALAADFGAILSGQD